jgi:hypothetical protein
MGINYGMGAAALGGAAIPFIQAMRLRKEARNYKPTDLVPQQSRDIVQNLSQQLNAPATNYGRRVQDLNDARAARMAYAKRGAGNSSDFLRAMYGSEDMYNKGMRQIGAEGSAEQISRRAAYNAALGNLGAQEAASAQKNREALAALKQARDINFAKSGEALISGLVNSVVLQNPKQKKNKGGGSSGSSTTTPYQMSNPMQKPRIGIPFELDPSLQKYDKPKFVTGFELDPALTEKYNPLYPVITP